MKRSQVFDWISAHRRKRLIASDEEVAENVNLQKDITRLLGCVRKLSESLPLDERRHVDQVLGTELEQLLSSFCFDLSRHIHRNDADIAFASGGILAAVEVAFDPFYEVVQLFEEAGIGQA